MEQPKDSIFSSPENFHKHLDSIQANIEEGNNKEENENDDSPNKSSSTRIGTESTEDTNTEAKDSSEEAEETSHEEQNEKDYRIPRSRFNKEIEKRKVLEEQLNKEREERIRYETQLQMLAELQKAQTPETQPGYEEEITPLDPDTHLYYIKQINELRNQVNEVVSKTQVQTQQMQYANLVNAQQQAFEKEHNDFKDAYNYLYNAEINALKEVYGEEQARVAATQKLQNVVVGALNQGKNAAEITYRMAQHYGYSSKKSEPRSTRPDVNLDAINNNMPKSASISNIATSASMSEQSVLNIKSCLKDPNDPYSGVDIAKWERLIKNNAK